MALDYYGNNLDYYAKALHYDSKALDYEDEVLDCSKFKTSEVWLYNKCKQVPSIRSTIKLSGKTIY